MSSFIRVFVLSRAAVSRAAWLAAVLAAAGCTTTTYSTGRPVPRPPSAQVPPPSEAPGDTSAEAAARGPAAERPVLRDGGRAEPPRDEAAARSPATAALLEQSRRERAAGRYGAAASSLERALRIEPNDAALWVELAEVRLDDGDRAQAEATARKALTLTGRNSRLAARAESVIARAAACAGGRC